MNLPYGRGRKHLPGFSQPKNKKAGPTSAAVDGFGACGCKDNKRGVEKQIWRMLNENIGYNRQYIAH